MTCLVLDVSSWMSQSLPRFLVSGRGLLFALVRTTAVVGTVASDVLISDRDYVAACYYRGWAWLDR